MQKKCFKEANDIIRKRRLNSVKALNRLITYTEADKKRDKKLEYAKRRKAIILRNKHENELGVKRFFISNRPLLINKYVNMFI